MAVPPYKQPRIHNVPGNLFVDESCIDCDVCRWMCPAVYDRKGLLAYVKKQPTTEQEKMLAYSAMVACPTGSIRLYQPDELVKRVKNIFPAEIDSDMLPGVYHMGHHSKESLGATSYILRSQASNMTIMIDVPRFNSRLADIVSEEMGGIDLCILTHRDNTAHHDKWKARFPAMERVIHRADVDPDTRMCEAVLKGGGPWQPCADVKIIHTPGHTPGSICILYNTGVNNIVFTGDHIAYDDRMQGLTGFKQLNHGNVEVQEASMRLLAEAEVDGGYDFTWVLPSHGRMARFYDSEEKKKLFIEAADKFKLETPWGNNWSS